MNFITFEEAARRIGLLDKEIDAGKVRAIRRTSTTWRSLTVAGIRSRGVGRALWAKKSTSLRPIVKRMRVQKVGDGFTSGIVLSGLAALQEDGGRTKAHIIKPWRASRLAFVGPKGHLISPVSVKHPGSRIPAMPSAAPAVPAVEADLAVQLDKEYQKAVEKVGLNG